MDRKIKKWNKKRAGIGRNNARPEKRIEGSNQKTVIFPLG